MMLSNNSETVFCVPYNGDLNLVNTIAENYSSVVYELYGTDDMFSSGRFKTNQVRVPIVDAVEILRGSGIKFNYLLNAVIFDDYLVRLGELKHHLSKLRTAGVETITVSSPYLVSLAREMGFSVCTSLMHDIRSETAIRYYEALGYERIILAEDELRNIGIIKHLIHSTELPIEIIINNCCLKHCPFRLTHYNCEAIRHPDFTNEDRQHLFAYVKQCKNFWYDDPASFLRTAWIRPEELSRYKSLGVRLFKLTGRTLSTTSILQMLQIYNSGQWAGSVWDYLKPFAEPASWFGLSSIANQELQPFFDFFFEVGCLGKCSRCRHCDVWSKNVIKKVPDHWRGLPITGGANERNDVFFTRPSVS